MTYEYVCTACGHEWEAEQRISEEPLKKCPKCRRAKARRQVSGGQGFILKGGGWYADGYTAGPGAKKSESGPKTDSSAGSETASASAKAEQGDTKSKATGGAKPDGGNKGKGAAKAAAA